MSGLDANPGARVRVGVDVGGTFTKAVAFDLAAGRVVAQSVVPTSHTHADGVAAGVVEAVASVVDETGAANVELVTYSTTQAVNALLEGDVGIVGVVGIGRRPDLRKVGKRTRLPTIELAPGKPLRTSHELLDVTDGLDVGAANAAIDRLIAGGAGAVAVAEAFSPDDDSNEQAVAALVEQRGLPVCTSSELTGLYGLELRAVTAAINASIIPIALQTADVVESGVAAVGVDSPVMVMRGDGGATDLPGFRKAPVRTLYSGPAASVAGALRHSRFADGVVVEIGGTSTNVAAIKRGHPTLSYVTVGSHATALRSIDVRVIGVAGGSMLRTRRRKVYGVGPRSAHIAALPYACFSDPATLTDATVEEIARAPATRPTTSWWSQVVVALRSPTRAPRTCLASSSRTTTPRDRPRPRVWPSRRPVRISASTPKRSRDGCSKRRATQSRSSLAPLPTTTTSAICGSSRWVAAPAGSAVTSPRSSGSSARCRRRPR